MKLSSLDKAQYANIASIALFMVALLVEVYKYGFEPIRLLNLTNFLLAWVIFANIRHAKNTIHRIALILEEASRGKLEDRVVLLKDEGELKRMAKNLNYFLDVVETFLKEIRVPIEYAAQGKFFRPVVDTGFPGIFKQVSQALKKPLHDMKEDAELKKRIELNARLGALGGGIAKSLEVVYKDLLKSTERAKDIVEESGKTSELSRRGMELLRDLQKSFAQVIDRVEEESKTVEVLAERARDVGRIIELIRDVAEQTNLLALNAAIEAARVGEAGRGFAVVADEIRRLAERTQKATEDVSSLLTSIQEETAQTLEKSRQVVRSVKASTSEVEEFSSSIQALSKSAEDTARMARLIEDILEITANKLDLIIFKHNAYFCIYNLVDTGFYTDHRSCNFGKWYYSSGMDKFGTYEEYREVEGHHERLHRYIERALEVLKTEEPEKELIRRREEILSDFEGVEEEASVIFKNFDLLIEKLEGR